MRDAEIEAVVGPVLESFGLELDALEVVPAGKRRVVRIVVDGDGPQGRGPLLDDIAEASTVVSAALDATNVTGQAAYTLEVSSRGVGRPLTAPKHWRRNTDRLVKVDLVGGTQVTGRITTAGEDAVVLDVDGAPREVAYTDVTKALVQVELNRKVSAAGSDDEDEIDDEDEDDS
jgi:ribosome maturation factor RimP